MTVYNISKRFSTATSAATRLRPSLFSGSAAICALHPRAASTRKRTGRSESSKAALPELSLDFRSALASSRSLTIMTIMTCQYPLVNVYITIWKITIFNGKTHYKWPFSIAMLVITGGYTVWQPNARVSAQVCPWQVCPGILITRNFMRKHHCSCSRRIQGPRSGASSSSVQRPSLPLAGLVSLPAEASPSRCLHQQQGAKVSLDSIILSKSSPSSLTTEVVIFL